MVQKYKGNPDVVFLALARDDRERVKRYLESTRFAYQVIPETNSYIGQLGIYAYPTQLVVNKSGFIDDISIGELAANTIKVLTESIDNALRH